MILSEIIINAIPLSKVEIVFWPNFHVLKTNSMHVWSSGLWGCDALSPRTSSIGLVQNFGFLHYTFYVQFRLAKTKIISILLVLRLCLSAHKILNSKIDFFLLIICVLNWEYWIMNMTLLFSFASNACIFFLKLLVQIVSRVLW